MLLNIMKEIGCEEFRGATLPQPIRWLFFFNNILRCLQVLGEYSFLEHPFFISEMLNIMLVKLHVQCIETSDYSAVFNYFIVGDVPVVSSQSAAAFTCE